MAFPALKEKSESETPMSTFNPFTLKAESVMKIIKNIDCGMLKKFMKKEWLIKHKKHKEYSNPEKKDKLQS